MTRRTEYITVLFFALPINLARWQWKSYCHRASKLLPHSRKEVWDAGWTKQFSPRKESYDLNARILRKGLFIPMQRNSEVFKNRTLVEYAWSTQAAEGHAVQQFNKFEYQITQRGGTRDKTLSNKAGRETDCHIHNYSNCV